MSIRSVTRFPWVLGMVVVIGLSCAPRDDGVREPPNGEGHLRDRASGTVVIQIRNQNTTQATIYIIEDRGMRTRIGEVPPLSDRFFERTVWGTPSLQFDVRLLAGGTYRTDSIMAIPGDTIQVTIPIRP